MESITPTNHINLDDEEVTFIDVITIDMFSVVIPIFINAEHMFTALNAICKDVDSSDPDFVIDGMACLNHDEDGCPVFAVYLSPTSTADVWVHEASHIVDMVFDTMGVFPGWESTETRAYMLQHVFRSMAEALCTHKEKQLSLETKEQVH